MTTNVRWLENGTVSSKLLQTLATQITNGGLDSDWILAYPANLSLIDRIFVLKKKTVMGAGEDIFVEFYKPEKISDTKINNHFMEIRFGTQYTVPISDNTLGVFSEDCGSLKSRFSWFMTNSDSNIKSWVPIKYWLSINSARIIIILKGDPSGSYTDALTSFAYIGMIEPFKYSVVDELGNFGVTTSSDLSPYDYLSQEDLNQYSDLTGTGVLDFCMLRTSTGFPFQSHFASFTTPDEFANKKFEGPSSYTRGYHFSKINLAHEYHGYIGTVIGLTVGDSSSLKEGEEIAVFDPDGSIDITYQVFFITAPYSFLNNGANVLYTVCLLKGTKMDAYNNIPLEILPNSQTIEATNLVRFTAHCGDLEVTNFDHPADNATVWTVAEPSYVIKKGTVQTTNLACTALVTATWRGKTATATLNVISAVLHIVPNMLNVPVGVDNLTYKCYYGSRDVTASVVWSSSSSKAVLKQGTSSLERIMDPITSDITATYTTLEGTIIVAHSSLTVYNVVLTIVPSDTTIQLGKTTSFKAYLNGVQDVTLDCVWTIDNPHTVLLGVTSALNVLGNVNVQASLETYGKTANAVIHVVDNRIFEIHPDINKICLEDKAWFIALLDGINVTKDCIWSISTPYSIIVDSQNNTTEVPEAVIPGTGTVTATHTSSGKVDTAVYTAVDNLKLEIVPSIKTVDINSNPVQFSAYLDTLDVGLNQATISKNVTSECTWNIPLPYLIGLNTGIASNFTQSGTAQVTALYSPKGKSANSILVVNSNDIEKKIGHSLDYYLLLDWDMINYLDLDFYANWTVNGISHSVCWYTLGKKYTGSDGTVALDHDSVRNSIPLVGDRTDPINMEMLSVQDMFDIPITFSIMQYNTSNGNNISLKTPPVVRIFKVDGSLVKTYSIPINLINDPSDSIPADVCIITQTMDKKLTIIDGPDITVL